MNSIPTLKKKINGKTKDLTVDSSPPCKGCLSARRKCGISGNFSFHRPLSEHTRPRKSWMFFVSSSMLPSFPEQQILSSFRLSRVKLGLRTVELYKVKSGYFELVATWYFVWTYNCKGAASREEQPHHLFVGGQDEIRIRLQRFPQLAEVSRSGILWCAKKTE